VVALAASVEAVVGREDGPPVARQAVNSISVLPFTNRYEDRLQEYLADRITEDIITDFSKVSGLFVITRTSSFPYKCRSVHVQ